MDEIYGLEAFVTEVRRAISRQLPPVETLDLLAPGFKRLLANRSFLRERMETGAAVGDEICLYSDPDFGFVVLARGVSPRLEAQGTSHAVLPHDHGPLWALYGIYDGKCRLCRYEPDDTARSGDFPGLRLTRDVAAQAGDFDAIAPHSMHLPVSDPRTGSVIVVVYDKPLESVIRRGYARAREEVIEFQGIFPPQGDPTTT